MTFEIGDVVELKSGSPLMTVTLIGDVNDDFDKNSIYCVWFTGTSRESAHFDYRTLKKVNID